VQGENVVSFTTPSTKEVVYIAVWTGSPECMDSAADAGEERLVIFVPVRDWSLERTVWRNADLDRMRRFLCSLRKIVNPAIGEGSDIVFSIAVIVRFVMTPRLLLELKCWSD
jgi:hypothetical protein